MRIRFLALLCGALLAAAQLAVTETFVTAQTQGQAPATDARLNQLPPALREAGQAILAQTNERERARLVGELIRKDAQGARAFLLDLLANDPAVPVRTMIVDRLGRQTAPAVRSALEQRVLQDKDTGVVILALERLRAQQAQELAKLLTQRLEQARRQGDEAALRQLGQEHERWISLVRGTMLPAFMRRVPPAFTLKPADQSIRVLAFGDFGNGSKEQKEVAAAMLKFHRQTPFDFAVTLGDNFYSYGMDSTSDPRWKTWWDELYDPLGIRFYATLGNHDWGFADSPAAEILYSQQSPSWRMPAPYYTFSAGPVQFFALDTNEVSEAQLLWLKDELAKSTARWKLVYAHHPVYSAGAHQDNPGLIQRLLPVLKTGADVYLAGHDHDLQHLKAEDGVHFFVAGGGGAGLRPLQPNPRSLFAKDAHAFAVVEADAQQLKIRFVDRQQQQLYAATLRKTGAQAELEASR